MNKIKRNYCLDIVKKYGATRNIEMAQVWLDRAMEAAPLTELQLHNIKMKMRDSDYRKLNLPEDLR